MIIFDSHTHNTNSHDAVQTAEEQLASALSQNFKGYAVTDHCEVEGVQWDEFCREHIPLSIAKAKEMKKLYEDKIIIAVGVEIGGALFEKERAKDIIENNDLDFVLCSCHAPKGKSDYCRMDYAEERGNVPKLLGEYFDMLERASAECDFDSLAHITYPIRYIQGIHKIEVDLSVYNPVIEKILVNLIKRDKAMEVNTSGYRQPLGMPMPHGEIIAKYKNLGGKLITIGSDAHRDFYMGKDFDKAFNLLKNCGFDKYYYYQNRKPIEISL